MCLASDSFLLDNWLWKKDRHRKHKLVIAEDRRLSLIKQAHDDLGHKKIFMVQTQLAERFWWPGTEDDIKWYIQMCHKCQLHSVRKILIPPTVLMPAGLFFKVYIDTMLIPKVKGYLTLFTHAVLYHLTQNGQCFTMRIIKPLLNSYMTFYCVDGVR